MKREALMVYSWAGLLKTKVSAFAISSREDARRLGPFADLEGERSVLWRRRSINPLTKRLARRSHFAYYPDRSLPPSVEQLRKEVAEEVESEQRTKGESARHRKAQLAMVDAIKDAIARGMALKWAYRDKRLSYSFKGNLLAEAIDAIPNYMVRTAAGDRFYVDVAIIGRAINRLPIVVGAVEIEYTHEFSMAKCLMLRSLGFPLFSIDVSETTEDGIDSAWASKILAETTWTSSDERRRNYVYLNDVLAPVFLDAGHLEHRSATHQFLVFAKNMDLEKLDAWLQIAAEKLELRKPSDLYLMRHNAKHPSAKKAVENAGAVAGEGWQDMNAGSYLLVQMRRPAKPSGALYLLHLLFARLVSSQIDAIVGYRATGLNPSTDGRMWTMYDLPAGQYGGTWVPVLPMQVSYPASWVMRTMAKLSR